MSHDATERPDVTPAGLKAENSNAPGRTRTSDPRFRKPVLYPTELRALDEILAGLG